LMLDASNPMLEPRHVGDERILKAAHAVRGSFGVIGPMTSRVTKEKI
jgi:hypothetical protein